MTLTIKSKSEKTTPGNLKIEVVGNDLHVPQEIIDLFTKFSINDFEEFLSYLYSFPTGIAAELGMTVKELISAKDDLCKSLHGYFDDKLLNPPPPRKHGYGALPPKK